MRTINIQCKDEKYKILKLQLILELVTILNIKIKFYRTNLVAGNIWMITVNNYKYQYGWYSLKPVSFICLSEMNSYYSQLSNLIHTSGPSCSKHP